MDRNLYLLGINRLPRLKPQEKLLLWDFVPTAEDLEALPRRIAEEIIGRRIGGSWNPLEALKAGEADYNRCQNEGIEIIDHWDDRYPPQLREIFDPPFLLFLRGELPLWDNPVLGVVGTRYPTGVGRIEAFAIGFNAASEGVAVVSGLAKGIDTAAHRGNRLGGEKTLAVMACGLDEIYPRENRAEAHAILKSGGAIISEYPPGTAPLKYHFPARNRIISGLSRWVVIVEAPRKSGALITGDFALDQGRELFVHPLCGDSPAGVGGDFLLSQGAEPWKNSVFLAKDRKKTVSFDAEVLDISARTGNYLAHLMEDELSGNTVRFHGEIFKLEMTA